MKNYALVLTCCVSVITMAVLVSIALILCAPWWVLIPMIMIGVGGAAYIDFLRFFGINK